MSEAKLLSLSLLQPEIGAGKPKLYTQPYFGSGYAELG